MKLFRIATLLAAGGAAATAVRRLKGGQEQRYSSEPDGLPNTPDRPATTTPPPGAGTRQAGADTGTLTETERARLEQTR